MESQDRSLVDKLLEKLEGEDGKSHVTHLIVKSILKLSYVYP